MMVYLTRARTSTWVPGASADNDLKYGMVASKSEDKKAAEPKKEAAGVKVTGSQY
jgi:hypothetical protein